MTLDPGGKVCEAITGLRLELEWLRELFLSAGPFEINHQFTRDRQRHARTKVFFDQGQRKIDSRGDAGAGIKLSVLQIESLGIDLEFGKTPGEIMGMPPVCRDAATIEQSSRGESVSAGANCGNAPGPGRAFTNPLSDRPLCLRNSKSLASWNDDPEPAWMNASAAERRRMRVNSAHWSLSALIVLCP